MIYIPIQWLNDEGNLNKVQEIIDSGFFSDVNLASRISNMVERLREIGEDLIADKLLNGEIVLPS
ncbi:hypothetical protein [Thermicanus aegyptius]|uniref:hypothetical protein n=1 Tax=Thermicanus aegyptius TaxID=94009 RepID=UPI00041DAE51|nr:hypothetical protein [Thermicanus aegyptius]